MTGASKLLMLCGVSANNIGDDAILISCYRDIKALLPDVEIRVLAAFPSDCGYLRRSLHMDIRHGLFQFFEYPDFKNPVLRDMDLALGGIANSCRRALRGFDLVNKAGAMAGGDRRSIPPNEFEVLENFLWADAIFDVGGANLNSIWENYFFDKCFSYLTANALGKPLILSGQSIEILRNEADRYLLSKALSIVDLITVRELTSFSLAQDLGVAQNKIFLTGDDAITLPKAPASRVEEIFADESIPTSSPLLGFQFRNYLEYNDPGVQEKMAAALDLISRRSGMNILALPMHYGKCDERGHVELIRRKMRFPEKLLPLQGHYTPSEIKSLIAEMYFTIGISYHFFIFSSSSGVPCIPLFLGPHYSQKVSGLSERYGLDNLGIKLQRCSPEDIAETVCEKLKDRHRLSRHLLMHTQKLSDAVWISRRKCAEIITQTRRRQ